MECHVLNFSLHPVQVNSHCATCNWGSRNGELFQLQVYYVPRDCSSEPDGGKAQEMVETMHPQL